MQLHLLHLDDAFVRQHDFLQSCAAAKARVFEGRDIGSHVRLWVANDDLDHLRTRLARHFEQDGHAPRLCFMGSGDFHHVSALLIEDVACNAGEDFTVLHFDNHPDWVKFEGGVHCGSWVNLALALPAVDKVLTVGVCSDDLSRPERKGAQLRQISDGRLEIFPYRHGPTRVRGTYGEGAGFRQVRQDIHWRQLELETREDFVELILSRIATTAVYITIDKDVLSSAHVRTNWDQGDMSLDWLLAAIERVGARHKILGADVIGDYSSPSYKGSLWRRALKRGEIMLDQPRPPPDLGKAANMNSATNLAILQALTGAMS